MRPWMDRAVVRGRIHGRLLLALIVIAVIACLVAVWQFGILRDDDHPEYADIGGGETIAPAPDAEPDTPTSGDAASTSPLESAPASTEAAATTSEAAESSAPVEDAPVVPPCTASLTLDDQSDTSVSVTVAVVNTGTEPIDGWEVLLDLDHLTVTSTWGLSHIEGDRYGDILFNAALDPGDGYEPSFRADVEGEFDLPATVPCTPDA
ncbi:cellulose binding domain-containing protein [Glycomyces harbinensis]|uniref:Cellulose binding domain-containing protein n=1 Tax=Glycomyces harbinensis TaxID=58114 RepID=A0A1G7BY16_9ACTN|nr:cellulose binding domain-containing protein [Glycomyces harbinensis]SDE31913.1 Cellulose binding domain-containing protein [Glycomyces harbinensis]